MAGRRLLRLLPQAVFIGLLCACATGTPTATQPALYSGPVEGQIIESERKQICHEWDALFQRTNDEADIKFPSARSDNTVVAEWKLARLIVGANGIAGEHRISKAQFRNVISEGAHYGWSKTPFVPEPIETASARAFREEQQAKAVAEARDRETKKKEAEEKSRLAARTPEQKADDEARQAKEEQERNELAARRAKEQADQVARLAKDRADRELRNRQIAFVEIRKTRTQAVEDAKEKFPDNAAVEQREALVKFRLASVATRLKITLEELASIEAEGTSKNWPKK